MPRPGLSTRGNDQLYRRLGGPQGSSGWARKIAPFRPGFDPWAVQLVAIPAQASRGVVSGESRVVNKPIDSLLQM
jgi:hypothetical protein